MKKILISIGVIAFIMQNSHAQTQLNLKECINYGLQHNRLVKINLNNVELSKLKAKESLATYLPQVNVNAGLDNNIKLPVTIIPAGSFGPGTDEQKVQFGTQFNSNQSIQLDQPIYNQASITGLKARKPNIELAEFTMAQNKQTLIYNIISSYYKIIIAEKQLELLESNKLRIEKILKVAQLQAEMGVSKKVDVKQIQVNLNNTVSNISITQNQYELALNTLKFNLGMPMSETIVLTDTDKWLDDKDHLPKDFGQFDFSKTYDYLIQKTQISLLEINKKYIRDGAFPTLGFYARYGANGYGQHFGDAYSRLFDFSTIGLKFNWSLFTGGRRDAQYKMAGLDIANAQENLRVLEEQQQLTFMNAGSAFKRAQSTISVNKDNMELAQDVYDNVSLQQKAGVANLSDLLNAELSLRQAQNNYIQSLLDYYVADLEVKKVNNTIESFYNNL